MCLKSKICNKCEQEKDIKLYRRDKQGYYNRTCKDCQRNNRREKSGSTYIDGVFIQKKSCNRCKIVKLRTEDNFSFINKKGGYRKYSKICLECTAAFKGLHGKNGKKREIEGVTRICRLCAKEQDISEFYKNKSGYNSYVCIRCEAERKKKFKKELSLEEREIFLSKQKISRDKAKNLYLLGQYKKFDFERNLETDVTAEYIKESLTNPCSYCQFPSTGLDRMDNTKGHTIENSIPCCQECNSARMNNFSHKEMKIMGQTIREIKLQRLIK